MKVNENIETRSTPIALNAFSFGNLSYRTATPR